MTLRKRFTREFKLAVVNELEAGKSIAEVSRVHNVHHSLVTRWRKQIRDYPDTAFSGNGRAYTLEAKLAESQRLIGKLYAENELLKKVTASLRKMAEERRRRLEP